MPSNSPVALHRSQSPASTSSLCSQASSGSDDLVRRFERQRLDSSASGSASLQGAVVNDGFGRTLAGLRRHGITSWPAQYRALSHLVEHQAEAPDVRGGMARYRAALQGDIRRLCPDPARHPSPVLKGDQPPSSPPVPQKTMLAVSSSLARFLHKLAGEASK